MLKYYKSKYYRKIKSFIRYFSLKYIAKRSNGEKAVAKYLKGAKIKFNEQVPLKIGNRQLYLDFQLEDGTIIEYNGRQHYEYTPYFHKSESDFIRQCERDKDLRNYCQKNNVKLIEIPYSIVNIDEYLNQKLCE